MFCDMTIIDGNSDGTTDGVINLYDEYTSQIGGTLALGTWFDPGFNFALDEATGDLFLWDLDNSSVMITDYQFELTNPSCTTGVAITLNIILGPFPGVAVPTIGIDVNAEVCDIGIDPCMTGSAIYDLNQALLSIPSAHANGIWEYRGTSPNFLGVDNMGIFTADVPYQSGPPLVDEETFELFYVVPGLAPCTTSIETSVRVSVIRQVFAGFANEFNICESELIAGTFDNIDLRGDDFLVNEDIEGIWLDEEDPTGQISGPGDSVINLGEVYDDLVATNPKFGCETYEYTYFVQNRSAVCDDQTSSVKFTFHEELRPFAQSVPNPEFCIKDDSGPTTFNLYDLLTFETEGTILFDYPSDCCTNWTLISGPSNLGLISNSLGNECTPEIDYNHLGTINLADLTNAEAGTYTFEYLVRPEVNCGCGSTSQLIHDTPDGCNSETNTDGLCGAETAQVTIIINPFNYAGENTPVAPEPALEFCESSLASPFDLITLLNTDGINDPIYVGPLGTWTDLDTGMTITNPYTFPEIDVIQIFNFNYSTTTPNDCTDSADLTVTIYEEFSSGADTVLEFCESDSSFELLDVLDGDPNDNGIWTFPDGTFSTDSNVTFNPATSQVGTYTYVIPNNLSTTDPTMVFCSGSESTLTISVVQNANPGMAMQGEACLTNLQYDLLTLLDPAADSGGTFVDIDMTGALTVSIVDLTQLIAGDYTFEYQIQGNAVCPLQTATLTLTVFEELSSGIDTIREVCVSDIAFNIFDILEGDPSANGTWTFPDGTMSTDNNVNFNPGSTTAGVYIYTVSDITSTTDPTVIICAGSQSNLTINVFQNSNPGRDNDGIACKSDLQFDLLTLLDSTADSGGTFVDITTPPTGALSGSTVDLTLLAEGDYTFEYQIQGNAVCPLQTAVLVLTVTDLIAPTINNESFCILLAATLEDFTVNGATDFEWYDTATSTPPLDINTILVNGEDYYVAATDSNNICFSTRTMITATIIPFGQSGCMIEIPDGVSPNNDSQNDDLDLSNLPQIFTNYEIKIFNRYGVAVFIGNRNTAFFSGKSNVSLSIGENLPSGTYFYVFDPKDNITKPFQGNFYLSR